MREREVLAVGLMLTPAENNYPSHKIKDREKFIQERMFLRDLVCHVPGEEVLDYLRSFIGKIEFEHPLLKSLSPRRQQEILLFVFREHLVVGESFSKIRKKFFQPPFSFPDTSGAFPGEFSLTNYYGASLFVLANRWPEIAQRYSLTFRKESIIYGRTALERLKVDEATKDYLEQILDKVPLAHRVVIQALASGRLPFEPFATKFPYLTRFFPMIVRWRVKEGYDYLPARELARLVKYWLFSENIWLVSQDQDPSSIVKSPHEVFCELIETIRARSFDNLPRTRRNRLRIQALQGLGRYLGQERLKEFLAALPNKSIEEKLQKVEDLRQQAGPELGFKETTVGVYVREIAATICDIIDGKRLLELLLR